MDRLEELRLLVAVVDAGSLAGAGRRLGHSPPAVTRALAGIEERLGVRLLERSTRRLAPTAAGRHLVEHARRLLADYAEAMAARPGRGRCGAAGCGSPRRWSSAAVTWRRSLADFLAAQPEVTAELALADRNVDLLEEAIDVALRIGVLADSTLVARRVGQVRRVVAASPAYLVERRHARPAGGAGRHDIVGFHSRATPPDWRFHGPGGREVINASCPASR